MAELIEESKSGVKNGALMPVESREKAVLCLRAGPTATCVQEELRQKRYGTIPRCPGPTPPSSVVTHRSNTRAERWFGGQSLGEAKFGSL